jgi:hypothetical protein
MDCSLPQNIVDDIHAQSLALTTRALELTVSLSSRPVARLQRQSLAVCLPLNYHPPMADKQPTEASVDALKEALRTKGEWASCVLSPIVKQVLVLTNDGPRANDQDHAPASDVLERVWLGGSVGRS